MSKTPQTTSKAIRKYLDRYSALSIHSTETIESTLTGPYHQAVVIPAYNETDDFVARFSKLPTTERTLLIIVANCPTYSDSKSRTTTNDFITQLNADISKENVMKGVTFGHVHSTLDILLLDLTLDELPLIKNGTVESGVGFARKVGMDMALLLNSHQIIQSPWMYSSDADGFWTPSYLSFDKTDFNNPGAIVLSFNHQQAETNAQLSDAAALYDISLRYYVLGLRWAGSPWAYHTVGSTLLVHAESYAQTRGFPVREAGEDFYLLNKVAKTGTIHCPEKPHIHLSDRPSQRVPFGTGPAVNRISQQTNWDHEFSLYHPHCFVLLRHWHNSMAALYEQTLDHAQHLTIEDLIGDQSEVLLRTALWEGLISLGLNKALNHAKKQSKSQQQFLQQLWQWFDGFRTLKLIHYLRDSVLTSPNYGVWKSEYIRQNIPFLPITETVPTSPFHISKQLEQLEKDTLPFKGGLH